MSAAEAKIRETFEAAKVKRIAIVDDGYDLPTRKDIKEEAWSAFRELLEEGDAGAFGFIKPAPGYTDLNAQQIAKLYETYIHLSEADAGLPSTEAVAATLSAFIGSKTAKLAELRYIEEFVQEATGQPPAKLGSNTKPDALVNYDLILLDFYLGEEMEDGAISEALSESARARAKKTIRDTMSAVPPGGSTPLFVLISSRATDANIPLFRDEAELLRSKFRFLQKGEFQNDRPKADHVFKDLVRQRDAADAIETLLDRWKIAIEGATSEMMKSVRRLDVIDYTYLQQFRLAEEKVSLLEYLTWLFNSYLGSFVERRLASTDASALASLTELTQSRPSALLRPFGELPRIYNGITTTQVHDFDGAVTPSVWTGDLFVRRKFLDTEQPQKAAETAAEGAGEHPDAPVTGSAEDRKKGGAAGSIEEAAEATPADGAKTKEEAAPDILAVITPVCDLVPGRDKKDPKKVKASSVLMIGGTLARLGYGKPSSHFVMLEAGDGEKETDANSYQIRWDEKWPYSRPIAAFDGQAIRDTDYVRTGRLRDLYAAELAGMMSGQLSRVGLPVTPPFSHPLSIRVIYKLAKVFELALDKTSGMAWELFPERTKPNKRSIVLAEELVWEIRAAARKTITDVNADAYAALTDHDQLLRLTSAFPVNSTGLTEVSGKVMQIQRLESLPEKIEILGGDARVVIQLIGPLKDPEAEV